MGNKQGTVNRFSVHDVIVREPLHILPRPENMGRSRVAGEALLQLRQKKGVAAKIPPQPPPPSPQFLEKERVGGGG